MNNEDKETIVEKKINHINKLVQEVLEFTKDEDECVRYATAEALYDIGNDDVIDRMVELLSDKDELVVINALEYIENWGIEKGFKHVKKCLKHDDCLVRRYAIDAICDLRSTDIIIPILVDLLKIEDEDSIRIRIYNGLVYLGEYQYISNLINNLHHESSSIRCTTAYLLADCMDAQNNDLILEELLLRYIIEDSKAVLEALDEAITEFEG